MHLNNSFQFLNIIRIFIHFFIHTYFQKMQIMLLEQYYQIDPKCSILLVKMSLTKQTREDFV